MNIYSIVYKKLRNWEQRTVGEDTVTAGLKTTNTNPRSSVLPSGPLCPISRLLIDNQVPVHSPLIQILVFHRRPKCPNTLRGS